MSTKTRFEEEAKGNSEMAYFTYPSWLVHSSLGRVVQGRTLEGNIALISWARHSTPTVALYTQVYNLLTPNLILTYFQHVRHVVGTVLNDLITARSADGSTEAKTHLSVEL